MNGQTTTYDNSSDLQSVFVHVFFFRISVVIICLPPCIIDRLKWSVPNLCWWDPSKNIEFAYFLSLVGHHLPCIIIIFCYIRVFMVTRKQFKVRPGTVHPTRRRIATGGPSTSRMSSVTTGITTVHMTGIQDEPQAPTAPAVYKKSEEPNPRQSFKMRPEGSSNRDSDETQERINQEKKIFVTLSYILITYMICWVPFHFMYDLTFLSPGAVSPNLFTFGFWMTYLNSTLNPVIYAFSNKEFRKVAKRVITCKNFK